MHTDGEIWYRLLNHHYARQGFMTEAVSAIIEHSPLQNFYLDIQSHNTPSIKLAKKLGPGKTVVTVLPDTAERYFSTPLFED